MIAPQLATLGFVAPWQFRVFAYLQLLDLLTTLVGLRLGAEEVSPFVRMLTRIDPLVGLAVSKLIAFALAAFCWRTRRLRVIGWVNHWFALLVLWNVCVLLLVA